MIAKQRVDRHLHPCPGVDELFQQRGSFPKEIVPFGMRQNRRHSRIANPSNETRRVPGIKLSLPVELQQSESRTAAEMAERIFNEFFAVFRSVNDLDFRAGKNRERDIQLV